MWEECLVCKSKCCQWKVISRLFTTQKEREKLPDIEKYSCKFFNKKTKLCDVHNKRPIDCRLFPFDAHKINGKFFWKIWKVDCPIIFNKKQKDLEPYLLEHEKYIIPKFKKYLDDYYKFNLDELEKNFKYKILREIRF